MIKYLEGQKVKLAKFTDHYITANYIKWLNDPEVNRYLNTGRFPVAKSNIFAPDDDKNMMFAVMSNLGVNSGGGLWQDTEFVHYIGTCSLHDIDWIVRKAEIGYMLGEKTHWKAGIGSEVVSLLSDYAFNRLNLNKLTAGAVEVNMGSIKALEKNGFKQFAILEQEYYLDGKYMNTRRFHNFQSWYKEQL